MTQNNLKPFLEAVLDIAKEHCGDEFEVLITDQRLERERFLESFCVGDGDGLVKNMDLVFREIDFDTIVNMAAKFIENEDYAKFLGDIAETGLRFGQLDKARESLRSIHKDYTDCISPTLLGTSHHLLGDTYLYQSELDEASTCYRNAKQVFLESGDELRYAGSINAEGVIFAEKGQTQASSICFKDANRIANHLNNTNLIIQTSMNLANLSHTLGNYQESLMYLHGAAGLIDENDQQLNGKLKHNLGITHKAMKHTAKALKCFDEAITFAEVSDDYYLRTLSFLEKSEVLFSEGKLKESSSLLTSAFQSFSEFGDRLGMADSYKVFGKLSGSRSSEKLAKAFFENSLRISEGSENKLGMGETYVALGEFFQAKHDKGNAIENFRSAKENYEGMEAHARVAEINELLNKLM